MASDVEVQDAAAIMADDEEAVQNPKGESGNGEEIHGRDSFAMIAQKGQPALGGLRVLGRSFHPAGNGGFRPGLKRNGYVEPSGDGWRLGRFVDHGRDWMSELDDDVASGIRYVLSRRGALKKDDLLRHVYQNYPWFASKSELKHLVAKEMPTAGHAAMAVYTVGYQQKTIDGFLSGLLRQGISVIIDVRSNPVSRNYGFAGRTLSTLAEKVDIRYHHFPHLGIPSDERKNLNSAEHYEELFDGYRKKVLPREHGAVNVVAGLMSRFPSTLLCYEAEPGLCHRSHLAHAVSAVNRLRVVHLQ